MHQLREYQKEGVTFLRSRQYALLGDDPGLGKTVQAICALDLRQTKEKVLVICPAQVKVLWQRQFELWIQFKDVGIISSSTGKLPPNQVLVVNYDLVIRKGLLKMLRDHTFDTIICDEAHRLKNPKAKRTKAVLRYLIPRTRRAFFLTGTPYKNRPVDIYSLVSRCVPELIAPYEKYLRFVFRYCGAFMDKWGLNVTGASHIDELRQKLQPFILRREKRDVLDELPPLMMEKIEFECSPAVRKAIAAEEEATVNMAAKAGAELEHFKLSEIVRLRQVVAKHKLSDAVAFIKDLLEEQEKLVVFFHHHDTMHTLVGALKKYGVLTVSGQDTPKMRQIKVDRFVAEKNTRIFLGQIQASGEGIDGLQRVCSTCVFVEPSWSPSDIKQCVSRLERIGQKDSINAYILVIKGTIESRMMDVVRWKMGVIDQLTKSNNPKPKEHLMYLEERVEKLEKGIKEIQVTLTELFRKLTDGPVGAAAAPTPAKKSTRKKKGGIGKKLPGAKTMFDDEYDEDGNPLPEKDEPAEEDPLGEDEDDFAEEAVTVETCRALAVSIVKEVPDGKAKCVKIINAAGGKKLADVPPDNLPEVYKKFQKLLA